MEWKGIDASKQADKEIGNNMQVINRIRRREKECYEVRYINTNKPASDVGLIVGVLLMMQDVLKVIPRLSLRLQADCVRQAIRGVRYLVRTIN